MGLIKTLFGDYSKREIKRIQPLCDKVLGLEETYRAMSEEELRSQTDKLRDRLQMGESTDDILPDAFAACREACDRVLGMRPFAVQILGGIILHQGRIAEMKTGEGKTLVATLPAYLNALSGEGVHIVTVNDYLARRDSEWMGKVYRYMGLTVGLIVHDLDNNARREAYAADITYGTNNELGFDYLRDNMVIYKENKVQRPHHFAIVDEVDSILIDEARTPLIISGQGDKSTDLYQQADHFAKSLKITKVKEMDAKEEQDTVDGDYIVDEKARTATLTQSGVKKAEQAFGVENLMDPDNVTLLHHINQAIKARGVMTRDVDYVVKDGQVIIVDEFTGRLMFGRRYSDGLHQAIEAKEKVKIERENQTLATITFQNYFRMYDLLSGMTGTAQTEETEFRKIYNFDVVVIPTNVPMQRIDYPDIVYRTEKGKYDAIVEEIATEHAKGRPVLVGTISIEKSEKLSKMLKNKGIPHQVLNAKYHEKEAAIIAQAGRENAVTIATNMAGRGTDIMLGGNYEALAMAKVAEDKEKGIEYTDEQINLLVSEYKAKSAEEHQHVVELGGLHIIGTERHESRRIDNQLRGRAGRQGDPGSTRFYISMEDDLMKRFGGDNLGALMDRVGMDDSVPIDSSLVSRSIEAAQKRVEERHFDARKTVLDYDDVMNVQRELIYSERRKALMEDDIHESVLGMIEASAQIVVNRYSGASQYPEEWDLPALVQDMAAYLPEDTPTEEEIKQLSGSEVANFFYDRLIAYYDKRREAMGAEVLNALEHAVVLQVVDRNWMDHLDAMDQLRQGIGLRAYGQIDPLVAYKKEAFEMFESMIDDIRLEVTRMCMLAQIVERPKERENITSNHGGGKPAKKQPIRKTPEQKIGRNDPCPCGSGKKYKNCCGKN